MKSVAIGTLSLLTLTLATAAPLKAQQIAPLTGFFQTVTGSPLSAGAPTLNAINQAVLQNAGVGSVTLQAIQEGSNAANNAIFSWGAGSPAGLLSQSIGAPGIASRLDFGSVNTLAAFSVGGPQLVFGAQSLSTGLNTAQFIIGDTAVISINQGSDAPGGGALITSNQNNILSAGYSARNSAGGFYIGAGPAAIQGQPIGSGVGRLSQGPATQSSDFSLNNVSVGVVSGTATLSAGQSSGGLGINASLQNGVDVGAVGASATINGVSQTNAASMNQISGYGGVDGAVLTLR